MDEFAQTRGADDLFDDDFTPLEDPPEQHKFPDSGTIQASPPHKPSPTSQPPPRDTLPNESHNIAPPQPHHSPSTSPSTSAPELPPIDPSSSTQPAAAPTPSHDTTTTDTTPTTNTTTSPPPPPTQPVRGPRHLSGGPTLTRLSEAELSAKLAAARLNSSRRAEAHARAEADEASFLQREARAGERRREEGRNRRVMDQERERNRLRKLEVGRRGGREWDEGKVVEEERVGEERGGAGGRGRGGFRGVNGGVGGGRRGRGGQLFGDVGVEEGGGGGYGFDGGRGFEGRGGRGRGRGRGARGGGEGRGGRGRGGFQLGQRAEQRVPDPQVDFPALPSVSKINGQQQALPPDTVKESVLDAKTEQPSWDDQVAESGGGW